MKQFRILYCTPEGNQLIGYYPGQIDPAEMCAYQAFWIRERSSRKTNFENCTLVAEDTDTDQRLHLYHLELAERLRFKANTAVLRPNTDSGGGLPLLDIGNPFK